MPSPSYALYVINQPVEALGIEAAQHVMVYPNRLIHIPRTALSSAVDRAELSIGRLGHIRWSGRPITNYAYGYYARHQLPIGRAMASWSMIGPTRIGPARYFAPRIAYLYREDRIEHGFMPTPSGEEWPANIRDMPRLVEVPGYLAPGQSARDVVRDQNVDVRADVLLGRIYVDPRSVSKWGGD